MTIGLSDTMRPSYEHYERWVKRQAPDVEVKRLSLQNHAGEFDLCDGLVLTGGGDVHPKFYGENGSGKRPVGIEEVHVERDEFELGLVHAARRRGIPVLGICRGMQLANVALGGTLIRDVEQAGYANHRKGTGTERYHPVVLEEGSLLHSIAHTKNVEVNTNHHQAVDRIGTSLRISGRSEDGLVESLEGDTKDHRPFVVLVQWHPERMRDFDSPCSKGILERFITEARQSHITSKI